MKKILVVAAHPDDEALGCGGTIARHAIEGDLVHLVLMADGVYSRSNITSEDFERRMAALKSAQSILGISSVDYLGLPDNRMDSIQLLDIVQKLEPIIENKQPTIVYTHHHGDLNIDHRITHEAVMTACRPMPNFSVKEIYGFEVMSSTEWASPIHSTFIPSFFVDISKQLPIKIKALEAYAEEMRSVPHSRSIKHIEVLARHRGYSIGVEAAEAFEVYRVIH